MASTKASCKSENVLIVSSPLTGGYMDLAAQWLGDHVVNRAGLHINKQKRPYVPRINHGGNYCGHQPDSPRLELVKSTTEKQRPGILVELQARMKRYFSQPNVLPSLRNSNGSRKGRQMRSERREACLVLLNAIIEHMDLVSLRCGIPTSKGFMSLTLPYLVQFTGLHPRRAERALANLKAANILTVSQPRQLQEDGKWRGLAAVKAVNRFLFGAFGLHERLKHEIERAAERLAEKVKTVGGTLTGWSRNMLVIGGRKVAKPRAINPVELNRARAALINALVTEQPHWTDAQRILEADRIITSKFTGTG